MFNNKSTAKLLFVLLFLLTAYTVPAHAVGKPVPGICFSSCEALNNACLAAGATPVSCIDTLRLAVHTCAGLDIQNPGAYVTECNNQGGTISGSSGGGGICTKSCI
jgi:hypothetical protein